MHVTDDDVSFYECPEMRKTTKPCINSTWIVLSIHGFLPVKTWLLIAYDIVFLCKIVSLRATVKVPATRSPPRPLPPSPPPHTHKALGSKTVPLKGHSQPRNWVILDVGKNNGLDLWCSFVFMYFHSMYQLLINKLQYFILTFTVFHTKSIREHHLTLT